MSTDKWATDPGAQKQAPIESLINTGWTPVTEKPKATNFNDILNRLFDLSFTVAVEPALSWFQQRLDLIKKGKYPVIGEEVLPGYWKVDQKRNIYFFDCEGNDPNGVLEAPKGSKAYNCDASGVTKTNTDGIKAWS